MYPLFPFFKYFALALFITRGMLLFVEYMRIYEVSLELRSKEENCGVAEKKGSWRLKTGSAVFFKVKGNMMWSRSLSADPDPAAQSSLRFIRRPGNL